ncbi:MAG: hypothetical protein RBT38_01795 [Bacteroidales bacterium]|jgi:hypothetical protein|nr:hypothetical protein [Bacteroidales bacterium]
MYRVLIFSCLLLAGACSTGSLRTESPAQKEKVSFATNPAGRGPEITIDLTPGESFYYPLFAIWLETAEGEYIQTLYVAKAVATGIFEFGKQDNGRWVRAPRRAPQTLPYWAHKRGIRAADGLFMPDEKTAVPDAYTGATPKTGFIMTSLADNTLPGRFRVMLETNQNWDWNEYWTNNRFPGDENYLWSAQPALVYEALIDMNSPQESYTMKPAGHSHYSGKTGELFTDLSSLTTALKIADSIVVRVK